MALLAASGAFAQGLQVQDLNDVWLRARDALGPGHVGLSYRHELALQGPGCVGMPLLEMQIGPDADGIGDRRRAGRIVIPQVEAGCQAREPPPAGSSGRMSARRSAG
jgi:hypothetical protein